MDIAPKKSKRATSDGPRAMMGRESELRVAIEGGCWLQAAGCRSEALALVLAFLLQPKVHRLF
jgi:hypothetical protein